MRGRTALFLLALAVPAVLTAQGGGGSVDSLVGKRADLEQQVRERLAKVTKQRLGATDEQMAKLEATNQKYDDQRRILVDQERDIRMALRDEMLRPDPAREGQVSALLDRINTVQGQRVEIQAREQQELSGFLTPLQRAKYFALEQQVRQRVNQLRQTQLGRGGLAARGQGALRRKPPAARGVRPPRP